MIKTIQPENVLPRPTKIMESAVNVQANRKQNIMTAVLDTNVLITASEFLATKSLLIEIPG
jgi:hypothetical protein